MKKNISIIIPTKNEEEGIAKVLCGIPKEIKRRAEVIVVDTSEDLTPVIARRLGAKVLHLGKKRKGKGFQMKIGAKIARGEILVFLDGDGTDPPRYISKLLKKLKKYDIVLGARNLSVRGSNKLYKCVFATYIPIVGGFFRALGFKTDGDPLAGFRAMKKSTWEKLNLKSNDFAIETEMNLKAVEMGLKVGEVPIPILPRSGGLLKSKLVRDVNQWAKVLNYGIHYAKGRKIKKRLKRLKKQLSIRAKRLIEIGNSLFKELTQRIRFHSKRLMTPKYPLQK